MIVADTNVVSEVMRDAPDPAVIRWAQSIDASDLTICVVTVEEIERGLGRLPEGRRRRELQQRWTRLLDGRRVWSTDGSRRCSNCRDLLGRWS